VPFRRILAVAVLSLVAVGMSKAALGVAWPSMARDLGRGLAELGVILAAFLIAYLAATMAGADLMGRFGPGTVLAVAGTAGAVALLGYALAPTWAVLVAAAGLAGAAGGLVDVGVNARVAVAGGARSMGILHAGFGVGATLGPLLMASLVASNGSWRAGFLALAAVQAAAATGFWVTLREWDEGFARVRRAARPAPDDGPLLVVSLAVFALYTGLEVGAAQWSYTLFTEERAIGAGVAGLAVAGFWAGITGSRILLGVLGDRLPPAATLAMGTATAAAAMAVIWWNPAPWTGPVALVTAGVALGPVFPLLMLATPIRVGTAFTPWAVGYQIAAASAGAAAVPGGIGLAVGWAGLETIGPVLLIVAAGLVAGIRLLDRLVSRRTAAAPAPAPGAVPPAVTHPDPGPGPGPS
jgi:fucose permease